MGYNFSRYTLLVKNPSDGDLYLHNSFMGAIIRLSQQLNLPDELGRKWRDHDIAFNPELVPPELATALLRNGFVVDDGISEAEKVQHILDVEAARIGHFIILPHEDCNFRCVYCYESFERGKMSANKVEAVKRAFSRSSANKEVMNVSWFGGEPTLAFDVMAELSRHFVSECGSSGIEYFSSATTNGARLPKIGEKALADCRINHYQITLDGPPEIHDTLRVLKGGQGTFDRVWAGLCFLRDSALDTRVAIRVNITPLSYQKVMEFIPELGDTFAADPRFYVDFHTVGHWGGPNDESLEVFTGLSSHDAKLELTRAARHNGFTISAQRGNLCAHGSVCYAGNENSIVIGSDGTLYKCTVAFDDERNKVGRLTDDGRLEVSPAKLSRWTENRLQKGKCSQCSFGASCQGKSCPLEAMDKPEPGCPYTPEQLTQNILFLAGSNDRPA